MTSTFWEVVAVVLEAVDSLGCSVSVEIMWAVIRLGRVEKRRNHCLLLKLNLPYPKFRAMYPQSAMMGNK